MRFQLLLLVILALTCGCRSTEGQLQCLSAYINEKDETLEYSQIRGAAKDTVAHWATLRIENFYGINRCRWVIDSAVFFNENKSKAVLLLLQIDTVLAAKLDYVQVMAAEKKEQNWHFYVQTLPFIIYDREENANKRPYTFQELAQKSRHAIIRGGYFDRWSCDVNYAYVNDWFKQPLSQYHQYFLHNRVEE